MLTRPSRTRTRHTCDDVKNILSESLPNSFDHGSSVAANSSDTIGEGEACAIGLHYGNYGDEYNWSVADYVACVEEASS